MTEKEKQAQQDAEAKAKAKAKADAQAKTQADDKDAKPKPEASSFDFGAPQTSKAAGDAPVQKADPHSAPPAFAAPKAGEVRVYRVGDSILELKVGDAIPSEDNFKHRGDEVASSEFFPASLEARYVETKAIELVRTVSKSEWDKEQAEKAKAEGK